MKNWLRKLLRIVFIAVFIIALGQMIRLMLDNRDAEQANSLAQSIAGATVTTTTATTTAVVQPTEPIPSTTETLPIETTPPETTEAPLPSDETVLFLQQLDLSELQTRNPDMIGWIYIPDTNVNYPLLHAEDNDTYLRTTWEGKSNTAGSIFIEARCSPDLEDFNTIIYGHNMRNGTMFAALKQYSDHSYYEAHPYVYIVKNDAIYRYEVFSSYETGVKTDTYRLRFTDDDKKRSLDYYIESSVWDAKLEPTLDDLILTLSTCVGGGKYETRWVVQAALNGQWEK